MATRIHVHDDVGASLFWGDSALVCGAEDAPPSSEVPTVRSAPSAELEGRHHQSGEHPCARPAADVDGTDDRSPPSISVEVDDEPCPETLRSPVSEGVSPGVRRPRVA